MWRKFIVLGAISALALGLLGLGLGLRESARADDPPAPTEAGVGAEVVTSHSGGAVKAIRAKVGDTPTTIVEPGGLGFTALPGASVTYTVPAGTTDTLVVTFNAECRLTSPTPPGDWIEVEVRLNGTPMRPDDIMAFCADDDWEENMATWVSGRIKGGAHTVAVFWKMTDNLPDDVLSAWFGDWTLTLWVSQ